MTNLKEIKEIIRAVIFASGNGILIDKIYIELTKKFPKEKISEAIAQLEKDYSNDSSILLIKYNNKLQFQTNPEYGDILADILLETKEKEISKTLLKVLAIIAYKQPITKAEISDIRGLNPDYAMSLLLRLNLITSVGRKDTIGRPILYGTTEEFLKKFGLSSLNQLPDYEYIMNDIQEKYDQIYSENKLFKDKDIVDENEMESIEEDDRSIPDFLEDEDYIEIE